MSKIEKALRKAMAERGAKKSAVSDVISPEIKDQNNAVTLNPNTNLQTLANKSLDIRRMDEESYFSLDELIERRIIHPGMKDGVITESFREIRTELLQSASDRNFIVQIASMCEGDDSEFISINLAAAFSLDKTKTSLVIDCNVGGSNIGNLLGIENSLGVLDYVMEDEMPVSEIIHSVGIKRLRVIPAGTNCNEMGEEYFYSDRLKVLLTDLHERYSDRYIFINSPPVSNMADVKVLSKLCDYVVIVVPYGKVTEVMLNATLKSIPEDKLLGFVFNDIP